MPERSTTIDTTLDHHHSPAIAIPPSHAGTHARHPRPVVPGFLAPEIGLKFFPPTDERLQLIESFGVFGGAFMMRPLGGMLFGYLGDKVVGRRKALELSIIVMSVPTVLLGCLPSYGTHSIGAEPLHATTTTIVATTSTTTAATTIPQHPSALPLQFC